jgi:amino acid adenylation domain-containing protein
LYVRERLLESRGRPSAAPVRRPNAVLGFDACDADESLGLQLIPGPDGPALRITSASTDSGADILRFGAAIDRFLSAMAAPSTRCSTVELLSEAELEGLDRAARGTIQDVPKSTIHGRFQECAARHPANLAVADGTVELTYRELDEWSDSIAGRLQRDYGIAPGTRVGVLLDSSPEQVIAALAAWKAGAVYVPLSAEWPQTRLDSILKSTSPAVVVCGKERGKLSSGQTPILELDLRAAPDRRDSSPASISPDDAAYLLYTSGSTGEPKGVSVSHDSLVNMALDQIRFLGVTERDRVLQVFSHVFDASLLNFTLALFSGAALITASRDVRVNGAELSRLAARSGVTVAAFVPSVFEGIEGCTLESVRTLIFGGEALTAATLRRIGRGKRIINSYGATETAVCTCAWDVPAGLYEEQAPIGGAIANTWVGLVNESGALVPNGCVGEIAVAGRGLAQGYWNDPESTAAKFVPHPTAPGGRIYLTGDRGRRLKDGSIEFLGRTDRQVKVRGFRVELAEIESALLKIGGVRRAHAEMLAGDGSRELIAWVAAEGSDTAAIKAELSRQIPQYMVPGRIVVVQRWPLNANGKTDVAALRSHLAAPPPVFAQGARSPLQAQIRDVWRAVLGREQIGIDDDFFALGGDSLKAIRLLARVQSELGLALRLSDFFTAPTIAEMVERSAGDKAGYGPALPRATSSHSYPTSFAQEGMYLLHRHGTPGSSFHMPCAFRLLGGVDAGRLRHALQLLVNRHESLRTKFVENAGTVAQEIAPAAEIHIEEADLRGSRSAEMLQSTLAAASERPFDLADPLKIRAHLFLIAADEHVLLLTLHHIIADGWSVHLLLEELRSLYDGRSANVAPTHSYRDFAVWQRLYVDSERGRQDRRYWSDRLSGLMARTELAPDLPRPRSRKYQSGIVRRSISRDGVQRWRSFAGGRRVSLFTVLVTAAKVLLHRLGCDDIPVGTPAIGRVFRETESLVGNFLNMLVLRDRVGGDATTAELLPRIQSTIVEALDHQAYPFELLARDVPGERLFNVEIDYHPAEMRGNSGDLGLSGLRSERIRSSFSNAGKFDLDVLFTEEGKALELELYYDAELFLEPTAAMLADELLRTIDFVVSEPDQPISTLAPIERASGAPVSTDARRARLAAVRERSRAAGPAVRITERDEASPAIVECEGESEFGVRWLGEQRERVEQLLVRYGGVRLCGFGIESVAAFSTLLDACGQTPIPYRERSSPRHTIGTNVYSSTDHPADQEINLHTEHSYAARWPMKIAFACLQPADRGGATPTADTRRVLAALPDAVVERFSRLGVGYIRNFGGGLGLDWADAFCTTDRAEVEAYCRANGMSCEWLGERRLRVTWTRPAVRRHPGTGQEVWFNHAYFFNVLSLEPDVREPLLRHGRIEDVPFQTVFGDGTPIDQETVDCMASALRRETVVQPWRKGDVLLLDNMLRAHGRTAYSGQRLVAVAMSEMHESLEATA